MSHTPTRLVFEPIDGILLLDKPVGISSHLALQKARRLLGAKKAGHGGTLDVLASGLLVLYFGRATKLSQQGLNADKVYLTTATLGIRTETGDAEGKIISTQTPQITPSQWSETLAKFTGEITQTPPMYSALKHQGKPLYEYARQGIELPRVSRTVTIHTLECLARTDTEATLKVHCSKGTYIRTLVDDIGLALGCGAYVSALRRLASGAFDIAAAVTLPELEALTLEQRRARLQPCG